MSSTVERVAAEVCILVDSCGDYAVGKDEAEARENYESTIQALADADGFRIVRVKLNVPLPAVVTLAADVPEVAPPCSLAVAAAG